jgi:hypothetical protein
LDSTKKEENMKYIIFFEFRIKLDKNSFEPENKEAIMSK